MTNFEYVFSLLAILLGLALAAVLSGFARAIKRRPRLEIGWGTGLLATWVITETVIFWEIIWRTRNVIPNDAPALFGGFAVTALYYFAASVVWPDDLERLDSTDEYFMQEKAKVICAILAAVALSFVLRAGLMGLVSWTVIPWYGWASLAIIYVAGPVAALTKRRNLAVGCLTLLVVVDFLDPIETIVWPG